MDDLYDFPKDHVGRKRFVSVRGHSKSVPAFKTYKGTDGLNYLRPEYGGDWSGIGNGSAFLMPDKGGYVSPMDGKYVEGRSAHREHMRVHNVLEAGDMKMGGMSGTDRRPLTGMRDDIRRAISERS